VRNYYTYGYAIYTLSFTNSTSLTSLLWSADTNISTLVKFQVGGSWQSEGPIQQQMSWYGEGGLNTYFWSQPASLAHIPPNVVFYIKPILVTNDAAETPILHDFVVVVGSVGYTLSTCPRCLGTGEFWDINLNDGKGKLEIIEYENKLGQDLEKIVLEVNNKFHNQRGNVFKNFNSLNPIYLRKRITQEIVRNIQRLKILQEQQAGKGISLPKKEQIKKVSKIDVTSGSDPRQFIIKIDVITKNYTKVDFSGVVTL